MEKNIFERTLFKSNFTTEGNTGLNVSGSVFKVVTDSMDFISGLFPKGDIPNKAHYRTKSVALRGYTIKVDDLSGRDYAQLSEQTVPTIVGLNVPMYHLYNTYETIIGFYLDGDFEDMLHRFSEFLTNDNARTGMLYKNDDIERMIIELEGMHKKLTDCFGEDNRDMVKFGKLFRNTNDIHDVVTVAMEINSNGLNDLTAKVFKDYKEINDLTDNIIKLLKRDVTVYAENGELFAKHVSYVANYFSLFSATVDLIENTDNTLITILKEKIK